MATTLSVLQAGSCVTKWIALIEGCKYVLTDCESAAAVQTALAGTDWASATVLPGLFVDLENTQKIEPWEPMPVTTSRCTLRVVDTDGTDAFGIYVNKRAAGNETTLTASVDRNDTTLAVTSTALFDSAGEVHIGSECVAYTGKTATTFTTCTRGKYSPFGCQSSGSGGSRWGNPHRIALDPNHIQLDPVVTQFPRHWMHRRVGLWMHTWDGATLNTKANAQLVFAGRIAGIADDPNTFHTVLELEHVLEELKDNIIGKDLWSATIKPGIRLVTGRTFTFTEVKNGGTIKTANVLSVVASGASGANQINADTYTGDQICAKLSSWLASEQQATRINGNYTWATFVSTNNGLRTRCYWVNTDASNIGTQWQLGCPGEVDSFLGLSKQEPDSRGQQGGAFQAATTNIANIYEGIYVPMTSLVFKPFGPGKIGAEFSEQITWDVENQTGSFADQRSLFPDSIKGSTQTGSNWGVFLLDDKVLMIASYASNQLTNAWLSPFQLAADNATQPVSYVGRRADETQAGPLTLRQVFIFEASVLSLLLQIAYSSGTSGYNHSTYDTLGYGLGLDMPGQLFGPEFELSISNMNFAQNPLGVVIDEPTKFGDLFHGDFVIRRSFMRWKDQHLEFAQWKTPVTGLSVASLVESNKAAPAGDNENHRSVTMESTEYQRPVVKIDYCRDFAVGKDGTYLKSVQIEDQTAVDDAGGNVKPITIKMRNTYPTFTNSGPALEAIFPEFMSFMPCVSRPWRVFKRTIDQRYFEGYSVGDIVTVTDAFARDPLTGLRVIHSRPGMITSHSYNPGGPTADGSVRPMGGEVEISFLDVHRSGAYSPAADIDDTASAGGFDHGYNNGTSTIRCKANDYSHNVTINTGRGGTIVVNEVHDATYFVAGDKILICERDPTNTASPVYWERTVQSQSADDIVLTATLSSPAWDNAKKYRVTPQKFSQVQTSQQASTYQALYSAGLIESLDAPDHWSVTPELYDYIANVTQKGEFVATMVYGDGRPYDVGNDRALTKTVNAYIDYKSAHQGPFLWNTLMQGVNSAWSCAFFSPVFFGVEILTTTVTRTLTVAPFFRATSGTAKVRVTLSRAMPTLRPGDLNTSSAQFIEDTCFDIDAYSQTAEWSTSSTTFATGADKTLSLNPRDVNTGIGWLTVECYGAIELRGLAKMIEGVRVVA